MEKDGIRLLDRVNEKIERITPDTLICGIDVGKTKCCARFCDFRGLGVYHKVWFDRTENLDKIGYHVTVVMYNENKTYCFYFEFR